MDNKVRRRELYELLKTHKEIQVADAAKQLGVSCMTIRRDLASMEKEDLVSRSYGKAVLKNANANELSFVERISVNQAAKRSVAQKAVSLVENASTIFLDGSTTCNELAQLLPQNHKYTVVTCNLNAVFHLRKMPNIDVFVLGGVLAPDRNNMDGAHAYLMAKNIYVDVAFVSCGGFSEAGIVDSNLAGSQVRETMLNHASKIVLMADKTKYMHCGLFIISDWEKIDHFVTDSEPEESLAEVLRANNVQLHIADNAN